MRLYELPEALRVLDEEIDANDGELSPELEARLDELMKDGADAVDSVVSLIQEHAAQATAEHSESLRLAVKAKRSNARVDRLKAYLKDTIGRMGVDRIQGNLHKVRIQKNGSPSIKWDEGYGDIPTEFTRVYVELDGTKAREAWKRGELPLGFTVDVGSHIRID